MNQNNNNRAAHLTAETSLHLPEIKGRASQYSITIDGTNVTKELSKNLYGLFYEDINSAADGGLYPEMVKNYSFENAYLEAGDTESVYFKKNGYRTVGNYSLHWTSSGSGSFSVEHQNGLNKNNPHYAVLTGNVTLENGGFAPQNSPNSAAMPVKPFNQAEQTGLFTFSVFVNAAPGYGGTLKVKLADSFGHALTDEQILKIPADGTWNKISAELTAAVTENTRGKLVLAVEGASASDRLCLDMISVVPHDSFGYGNPNYACGVGIRKDLIELMMDLKPKFMRFPGGCIVEGYNWEGLYDWRDTIGPLEERRANTNRWENWNNHNRTWGYMQSYGFGYHELLSLCEEFHMEPFPILNAGILCQYETGELGGHVADAKTGAKLQRFIDMAANLLDYCWGNAADNEWAKKRAANGHPETFNLKYLGIGNENIRARYLDNFEILKKAVEAYAQKHYPDHELHIISSSGPCSGGDDFEYAYDRLAQTMPGETLVDEHYYESESFMYNQSDRYDYYQRPDQGGSNVFVGEYAIRGNNKYYTALAEACYMTGLERNADVVTNISYAPLLYKIGNLSWDHDLIYFDEFDAVRSTNYYVQKMFSNHYGTKLIRTELQSSETDYSNYGSPILGTISAAGSIDKITVYDNDGNILLEDTFEDNSNGWAAFGSPENGTGFTITGGQLVFTGAKGFHAVYLPKAITEKWKQFKIVAKGVTKTSDSGSIIIGAGHDRQYYCFHLGKDGAGTCMEVTRPNRRETGLTTKPLGNNFANRHYNMERLTKIQTNDSMEITFNFGIGEKLEANYTSASVSRKDTAKYDFSSVLNQYQTDIYQVVNMDGSYVYIKLVNPDKNPKDLQLHFENLNIAKKSSAAITMLTGGLDEANAIGTELVAPVSSEQKIENHKLFYQLPAYSVNVIRLPLAKSQ